MDELKATGGSWNKEAGETPYPVKCVQGVGGIVCSLGKHFAVEPVPIL